MGSCCSGKRNKDSSDRKESSDTNPGNLANLQNLEEKAYKALDNSFTSNLSTLNNNSLNIIAHNLQFLDKELNDYMISLDNQQFEIKELDSFLNRTEFTNSKFLSFLKKVRDELVFEFNLRQLKFSKVSEALKSIFEEYNELIILISKNSEPSKVNLKIKLIHKLLERDINGFTLDRIVSYDIDRLIKFFFYEYKIFIDESADLFDINSEKIEELIKVSYAVNCHDQSFTCFKNDDDFLEYIKACYNIMITVLMNDVIYLKIEEYFSNLFLAFSCLLAKVETMIISGEMDQIEKEINCLKEYEFIASNNRNFLAKY